MRAPSENEVETSWHLTWPLVIALGVLGCGASVPTQMVIGRVSGSTHTQLWERTLVAVDHANYQPEVSNRDRGVILVPSRIYGSRSRFVIQLYREGWVQVSLETLGRGFVRLRVPADLAREQLELTLSLRRQLLDETPPEGGDDEAPDS